MYNSIYPINIHYRKPQLNKQIVQRKEEEQQQSSEYTYSQNSERDEFTSTSGQSRKSAIAYNVQANSHPSIFNKNSVNISQIVQDFKNTTAAIGTPSDVAEEVMAYLELVEKQSVKQEPNKKLIQTNLKNASHILDDYITKSLNKPSKVVENWVDAIFLQNVDYRADENAINPAFKVNLPQNNSQNNSQSNSYKMQEENFENSSEKNEVLISENLKNYENNTIKENFSSNVENRILKNNDLTNIENNFEKESINNVENTYGLYQAEKLEKQLEKVSDDLLIPSDKNLKREFIKAKKYAQLDNKTKALQAFKSALEIANIQKDEQVESMIYYEIGQIYDKSDVNDLAIKNYQTSIYKTENDNIKAKAHISMAKIYNRNAKFSPAMIHYHDAMAYAGQTENLNIQTKALSDVAKMYTEKYNKNDAFSYFELAKDIAKETQNNKIIGKICKNTAQACEIFNEDFKALDNLKESTFYYTKANSDEKVAQNYMDASSLMLKFGNKEKAQKLLKKAYTKYAKIGNTDEIKKIFLQMQKI